MALTGNMLKAFFLIVIVFFAIGCEPLPSVEDDRINPYDVESPQFEGYPSVEFTVEHSWDLRFKRLNLSIEQPDEKVKEITISDSTGKIIFHQESTAFLSNWNLAFELSKLPKIPATLTFSSKADTPDGEITIAETNYVVPRPDLSDKTQYFSFRTLRATQGSYAHTLIIDYTESERFVFPLHFDVKRSDNRELNFLGRAAYASNGHFYQWETPAFDLNESVSFEVLLDTNNFHRHILYETTAVASNDLDMWIVSRNVMYQNWWNANPYALTYTMGKGNSVTEWYFFFSSKNQILPGNLVVFEISESLEGPYRELFRVKLQRSGMDIIFPYLGPIVGFWSIALSDYVGTNYIIMKGTNDGTEVLGESEPIKFIVEEDPDVYQVRVEEIN